MKNHTKGPWRVIKRNEQTTVNGRRITVDAAGCVIADVDWNSPQENMANAHLIAAAPDLLAALKDMIAADNAICENIGLKSDQAMNRIAAIDAAHRALALAQKDPL